MTQKQLRALQERARKSLTIQADDYAEILSFMGNDDLATIEVDCVLLVCGYTRTSFMNTWAKGVFDV